MRKNNKNSSKKGSKTKKISYSFKERFTDAVEVTIGYQLTEDLIKWVNGEIIPKW